MYVINVIIVVNNTNYNVTFHSLCECVTVAVAKADPFM